MNTYSYAIKNLVTSDADPIRPKNVKRVLVEITATNPENQSTSVVMGFDCVDSETFIPFADLTESEVLSWITGREELGLILQQLDIQLTNTFPQPQLVDNPVPWVIITATNTGSVTTATATIDTGTIVMNVINTSTLVSSQGNVSPEYLKSLIYEVLLEINQESV